MSAVAFETGRVLTMLPALDIDDIEKDVRHKLKQKPIDAIALVFAPYAGERKGIVVDYLRRWSEYNFHSGEFIDLYHAGYARWCDSQSPLQGGEQRKIQFAAHPWIRRVFLSGAFPQGCNTHCDQNQA